MRRRDGFRVLTAPYWSSPVLANPRAGRHVHTSATYDLAADLVTEPGTYVQLESFRAATGAVAHCRRPVRVAGYRPTACLGTPGEEVLAMTLLRRRRATPVDSACCPPRMVPVCSAADIFADPRASPT